MSFPPPFLFVFRGTYENEFETSKTCMSKKTEMNAHSAMIDFSVFPPLIEKNVQYFFTLKIFSQSYYLTEIAARRAAKKNGCHFFSLFEKVKKTLIGFIQDFI